MNVTKNFILILLLPILTIAQECTTFNDIDSSTYKQDVLYASDKGWISCKDSFNPTTNTSRIEALKMALLAGGHNPSDTTEQCFDDVATDSWQNKYACYGKNSGLLTDNINFRPNEDVNFAEASKMILKSMTDESYPESDPWYQKYLDKMKLYPFNDSAGNYVNRDYFVHILREIEADPSKQPVVNNPIDDTPTPIVDDTPPIIVDEPIVEDNDTIIIDDNNTIVENNITDIVDTRTISRLSYMFTPYRCSGTTPPNLELKTLSDSVDSANNRVMELEFDLSGGTQSCIDEYGESHNLEIFTQWWAKDAKFEDLTASGADIRYKHIRVTIPNSKDNEVYLEIITSLGARVATEITIEANSGSVEVKTTYGLNGIEITDPNILAKIKLLIAELESIKLEVEALLSEARQKVVKSDDTLKKKFDVLKKRLDDAKKLLDDIKQAIDNSSEDKNALKKEADKIKKALDDIKKLIDGYKKDEDNSITAIDSLKLAIDDVIGMMVSESSERVSSSLSLYVPKGKSLISGNIDATKLPSEIYAVWIVDGGNWYGYSPKQSVRDAIKSKYRLIDKIIPAYKAVIVWADEDASIELEDDNSIENVTQSYGKNFTIHGTNNQTVDADDIVCSDSKNAITGLFKVSGDEPSVFVPNRQIDGVDNFYYIYGDEGYYVLCEKKQGGV